jgi:hypothetical protein
MPVMRKGISIVPRRNHAGHSGAERSEEPGIHNHSCGVGTRTAAARLPQYTSMLGPDFAALHSGYTIAVGDDWIKQLSDAGFLQAGGSDAATYTPTLSELIAACPKQFDAATFVLGSSQGGTRWTATYFDFRNNRMLDDDTLCQSGDTPEEAVARLWLAAANK